MAVKAAFLQPDIWFGLEMVLASMVLVAFLATSYRYVEVTYHRWQEGRAQRRKQEELQAYRLGLQARLLLRRNPLGSSALSTTETPKSAEPEAVEERLEDPAVPPAAPGMPPPTAPSADAPLVAVSSSTVTPSQALDTRATDSATKPAHQYSMWSGEPTPPASSRLPEVPLLPVARPPPAPLEYAVPGTTTIAERRQRLAERRHGRAALPGPTSGVGLDAAEAGAVDWDRVAALSELLSAAAALPLPSSAEAPPTSFGSPSASSPAVEVAQAAPPRLSAPVMGTSRGAGVVDGRPAQVPLATHPLPDDDPEAAGPTADWSDAVALPLAQCSDSDFPPPPPEQAAARRQKKQKKKEKRRGKGPSGAADAEPVLGLSASPPATQRSAAPIPAPLGPPVGPVGPASLSALQAEVEVKKIEPRSLAAGRLAPLPRMPFMMPLPADADAAPASIHAVPQEAPQPCPPSASLAVPAAKAPANYRPVTPMLFPHEREERNRRRRAVLDALRRHPRHIELSDRGRRALAAILAYRQSQRAPPPPPSPARPLPPPLRPPSMVDELPLRPRHVPPAAKPPPPPSFLLPADHGPTATDSSSTASASPSHSPLLVPATAAALDENAAEIKARLEAEQAQARLAEEEAEQRSAIRQEALRSLQREWDELEEALEEAGRQERERRQREAWLQMQAQRPATAAAPPLAPPKAPPTASPAATATAAAEDAVWQQLQRQQQALMRQRREEQARRQLEAEEGDARRSVQDMEGPEWEALSRTLRRQEADLRLRLAAAEREQRRLEEQRRLQAKVEARLLAQQREAEGPPLPEAHQPPTQEAEGSATAIAGEGEAEDPGMAADLDRGDDAGEPRAHRRHKKGRRKKEK